MLAKTIKNHKLEPFDYTIKSLFPCILACECSHIKIISFTIEKLHPFHDSPTMYIWLFMIENITFFIIEIKSIFV